MKKTIKAWAVFNREGDMLYRTVSVIRTWAKIKINEKSVNLDWKYLYRVGYRVRRITITVED
jgi:hypothetical protein